MFEVVELLFSRTALSKLSVFILICPGSAFILAVRVCSGNGVKQKTVFRKQCIRRERAKR